MSDESRKGATEVRPCGRFGCRFGCNCGSELEQLSARCRPQLTVLVEPGPCYQCPLCYDGSSCRAFSGGDYGEGVHSGRSPHEHANGRSCDPYEERPDWCPLVKAGEVVVKAAL